MKFLENFKTTFLIQKIFADSNFDILLQRKDFDLQLQVKSYFGKGILRYLEKFQILNLTPEH